MNNKIKPELIMNHLVTQELIPHFVQSISPREFRIVYYANNDRFYFEITNHGYLICDKWGGVGEGFDDVLRKFMFEVISDVLKEE